MNSATAPDASPESVPAPAGWLRLIVPLSGLAVLGALTLCFLVDAPLYQAVLRSLMLIPKAQPFIDWNSLATAIRCWQQGFDVYHQDACSHGTHMYSPLWLRADFLPLDPAFVPWVGLGFAIAFWLAIGLALPPPRRPWQAALMLLASLSSLVAFALERANIDVFFFLVSVVAVRMWRGRLPWRLLAYALIIALGVLKFYPFVLMGLALREKPRRLAALAFLSVGVLAAYILAYSQELRLSLGNMATGSYFTDLFGAVNLPNGIGSLLFPFIDAVDPFQRALVIRIVPGILMVMLLALTARRVLEMCSGTALAAMLAAMPGLERAMLIAGSLLICGCFLAFQNIGYRGIYLLMILPGLLSLAGQAGPAALRRRIVLACGALVFVLWVLTIRRIILVLVMHDDPISNPGGLRFLHWLLHELAWWWLIAVLLAVLVTYLRTAPAWCWLCACWARREQRRATMRGSIGA